MKIMMAGYGELGSFLTEILLQKEVHITLIDKDPSVFLHIKDKKITPLIGNALDKNFLKKAGVEDMEFFLALTGNDNANLMISQMARGIFQVPTVICRLEDEKKAEIYSDLGLDTVCRTTLVGEKILSMIIKSEILVTHRLGGSSAVGVEFNLPASYGGKTVEDIEIKGVFRIGGIMRESSVIIPSQDMALQEGDKILGTTLMEKVDELENRFFRETP